MNGTLGDIQWKDSDPLELYFDQLRQGVSLPRRKWIVSPDWQPCQVPGMEKFQEFFEKHVLPREWQLLVDFWTKLQCGTYFIKRPNWIEPPITARCLDLRTEEPVTVPPGGVATAVTVLDFTMPDLFIGTILGFGHEIADPSQWGTVGWNILINGFAIPCYQNFFQQIGEFVEPTLFPNPQRLKHMDRLQVVAHNNGAADAEVFARVYGFIFPTKQTTQDGSFGEYHVI